MSVSFQVFRGSSGGDIVEDKTHRELSGNQVYIETTHSGLCGTDEHFLHSGQVLGHEGIGIVRRVSPDVTSFKIGNRVGFAYVRKVCGSCDNCSQGYDQYCRSIRIYGESDTDVGSFSFGAVWDADCLYLIPDEYPSEAAAPLMCAGATVWQCLQDSRVRPGERVGVLGFGGLGHLAIKLAAAMGCEVVALSRSESKRKDAMEFGASEFHVTELDAKVQEIRPLKHLLLCGSSVGDVSRLVPLMDTNGVIYPLSVDFGELSVPLLPMMANGVRIHASRVSSRHNLRGLLHFASAQDVKPAVMTFPLTKGGIEMAMHKLRAGEIKYRAVLVR